MSAHQNPSFICYQCREIEQGEGKITNGLCTSCFNSNIEETRKANLEAEHDYADGDF